LLKTGVKIIASMPGGKTIIGLAIGVSGVTGYGIGTALNQLKPVSDAAVSLINAVTGYGKQSEFPTGEEYGQRSQEIIKTKIQTGIDRIKKSGLPLDTETEIAESTPQVGYNPLDDPNLKSGGKELTDVADAEKLGKEFQESQGGGSKTTTAQSPQNVVQQPESYTADPAKKPEIPGSTQQSPSQPYPPGYPPDTGSGTAQVPWDKLVGESSGHGAKTPSGSGSYGSSRSLNPPSPPPSSGMPPKTPVSTTTGKNEPTQAELKAAYNEGCRVGRQVRNGELSSAAVKELLRTTYDKGHKSLKNEFLRGWGDCSK
ncbi:MAG: hypothetical protein HYX79_05030, partial [Chloroflexi bacterium]|nr:hypothetical protein [Chloroflexota bacterium]